MAFFQGYALLIGVTECDVSRWALPGVSKDIAALEEVLIHPQRCGYLKENVHILTGKNATKQNIRDELAWLKKKLNADPEGNTTALVYYSGHGWKDNQPSEPTYYLIPCNVRENSIRSSAFNASNFAKAIGKLTPARLLVVLDCCHSGGMDVKDLPSGDFVPSSIPPDLFMGGQKALTMDPKIKDTHMTLLAQGTGRAVLNSSRSDERSYIRKDGKMSIFTYHLIESLTGYAPHEIKDRQVTVADVLSYLWRTVPNSARAEYGADQHPDGQLSGNFPVALLLGGSGTPKGKALPDPLEELPSDKTSDQNVCFDQSRQTILGQQNNFTRPVQGLVITGPVYGNVMIDERKVDTSGGDYVEGNKIVKGTEEQDGE